MKDNRFNATPAFLRTTTDVLRPPQPPAVNVEPQIFIQFLPRKDSEIWLQAWLSVAAASNSTDANASDRWADHCLNEYKKRFDGQS